MKRTTIVLAGLLWAATLAGSARAQPILDRVERLLRDQLGAGQNANPPPPAPTASGYLGVIADDRQEQGKGVRVLEVVAGGPAASGGIRVGDLITSIDGKPIGTMDDMSQALAGMLAGTKLIITVERSGARRDQNVTLGRRQRGRPARPMPEELPGPDLPPPGGAAVPPGPKIGIRTLPVTEEVRQRNNLADTSGAQVVAVTAGSPAARAGIPLGAVITAIDGQGVATPEDLAAAVRSAAGSEIELTYVDRGAETKKIVTLARPPGPSDETRLELRGKPLVPPAPEATADDRVAALEARIRELEARLEKLEASLGGEAK